MALPIVPIALAGGALLLVLRAKKGNSAASGITSNAVGAPRTVTGKSGTTWDVSTLQGDAAGAGLLLEVIYKKGSVPAQPHMVIRYVQQGTGDAAKRMLAATNPNTSPGLVQAAMADFGVTGPVAP